nr:MAG TPA: hypothetical protein [Crassvirales sp.]
MDLQERNYNDNRFNRRLVKLEDLAGGENVGDIKTALSNMKVPYFEDEVVGFDGTTTKRSPYVIIYGPGKDLSRSFYYTTEGNLIPVVKTQNKETSGTD